ncbi:MAG: competence/damage-inducible protein A [Planctomycetes bacterium]|nr:competence/damage-inducible protein A [Planctomycetota bacterium]MBI3846324.1 competence/damage-inducible protein A [Planctomycetota bacterium]
MHRTALIVVVGNEILTGKVEDTNSPFLARELYALGVQVRSIVTIADEVETIGRILRELAPCHDVVITTGGVGPTHDDVTLAGVARAFGVPVERHPEMERILREFYGAGLAPPLLRMADLPRGMELVDQAELRIPCVRMGNVWVFPGEPTIFRRKWLAVRERFRSEPFALAKIWTLKDEGELAPILEETLALHPKVTIGSYPVYPGHDYAVMLTIESDDRAAVKDAQLEILRRLPPTSVVRTE